MSQGAVEISTILLGRRPMGKGERRGTSANRHAEPFISGFTTKRVVGLDSTIQRDNGQACGIASIDLVKAVDMPFDRGMTSDFSDRQCIHSAPHLDHARSRHSFLWPWLLSMFKYAFNISLSTRINHRFSEISRNSSDAKVSRETRSVSTVFSI
jgi:hypothetical protein